MRLEFDLALYEGFDDIAHNRLLTWDKKTDTFKQVPTYGKRNKKVRCFCKEIRKLKKLKLRFHSL